MSHEAPVPAPPGSAPVGTAPPGIRFAGVGDEAGAALTDQLRAHRLLGWSAIELRNVDGTALADLDAAAFSRLRYAVAEAGLDVVCVDSRIANWQRPVTGDFRLDLDEITRLAPRCAALGTRWIRVMSYPDDPGAGLTASEWRERVVRRMKELARRAEDHGLVLLHENCAGWAGTDAARALHLLEEVDSPALRLLFDTGNGVAYGYEAHAMLPPLLPWVEHVQVKDACSEAGQVVYTLPGEGRCRVADCLELLLEQGWKGTWSIEPHLTVRPHEGRTGAAAGAGGTPSLVDEFVRYGRRLEALAAELHSPTEALR